MPVKKSPRRKSSKQFVQAKDFALLKHPRALALSPDGALLAYTQWWCDLEKKKYFANLHVLELNSGESRQWTFGEHTDREPAWSRDGSKLIFIRHEKGEDRVYLIRRDGGEAELLFKRRGSISSAKWAEHDNSLILKFRPADPDEEADKAIKDGKEPAEKAPAVRKVTRLFYRLDGDGFLPLERYHLYHLDLRGKEAGKPCPESAFTRLTTGKDDVYGYDVSPDGGTVAYVTNLQPDPDTKPFHLDLLLLNLKQRKVKRLNLEYGEKMGPSFSPDGKYLLYFGHHNVRDAWNVERVHPRLVDLKTGKERNLTPKFDRQPGDHSIGDLGFGLDYPVCKWSRDGKSFYYQISDEGDVFIARKSLTAGEPVEVWRSPGTVPLFDLAGDTLVFHYVGFENLGTLHVCENLRVARPVFRKLKVFNSDYLAARDLGKVKEVRFKSADGTRVHGWVVFPPNFNPRRKYPSILEVHGGPRAQYSRVFFHEMQYLAAQGYVVMFTNPRGSQGYGMSFAGAIVADWGGKDYEDVMAAADWLESQTFIDKKRMGITGGSYGGYMTNMVVGRTRRFRAAVTQRSVVDLDSFCGTSDIGCHDHYEFGGFPWENPEGYRKMNPLNYVENIRTPLLIEHQEFDLRCPIEQAEQLYAQLKLRGRVVELHRYPEESHGMSRTGRPDRRIIRLEAIAGWFKKYMK